MDSIEERVKALQQMPLLENLPNGDLERLAAKLRIESYEAGTEIIKQGASSSSAYLIVSGSCDVRRKTPKGSRRLSFLRKNDFFGELSILVPAPRSASVIAHEPVVVLVLTAWEFNLALRSNKAMALHLVKVLAERLQRADDDFSSKG